MTDNQTVTNTGAFSADLSGLAPGTAYYYKAKAVGADTVYGNEMSFTTSTTPPTVTIECRHQSGGNLSHSERQPHGAGHGGQCHRVLRVGHQHELRY